MMLCASSGMVGSIPMRFRLFSLRWIKDQTSAATNDRSLIIDKPAGDEFEGPE